MESVLFCWKSRLYIDEKVSLSWSASIEKASQRNSVPTARDVILRIFGYQYIVPTGHVLDVLPLEFIQPSSIQEQKQKERVSSSSLALKLLLAFKFCLPLEFIQASSIQEQKQKERVSSSSLALKLLLAFKFCLPLEFIQPSSIQEQRQKERVSSSSLALKLLLALPMSRRDYISVEK